MHFQTGVGVRIEAHCTFSFFQDVNQNHIKSQNKILTKLVKKKVNWFAYRLASSICAVHFRSWILIDVLKRNGRRTQPWSKTNWPFSMENMSCRWGGGGVPAYLPPLFLRTKQAMSTTRVRSATAHMVPMNQPWVEKSLRWPTAAENQNGKETQSSRIDFPHQCIWVWQSPQALSLQLFI